VPFIFERKINMTEEQNLLTGSVPKKLIAFAFPLLLANVLQSFYNVVDMLVVGQIVGDTGLAAISNASKLCYIINSICIGMTMGGAVLIAQYKGADDKKGQTETFHMLALLSLVTSLLVTVVSLAVYQPLFRVLDVPADAYQDACDYMRIICCGTVFVFGYNAVCSVLKGLGDSKSPLYFVGIATIINIILDILLVGPFGMGTAGAAYATITAQGISFVISLFYLKRHKMFFSTTEHKKFTLQWDKLAAIVKVGLPTAIQMVVVNTAYLLVTGMLNQFGTSVSAASGVGLQINTFAGMPCWAIGQAVTAMVGQCIGAGQIQRARKVVKISLLLNLLVTLFVVIGVQLFAEQLILLFGSNSPEVISDGVYYLRVCCGINSLIYAIMYTLDSFAIGVGAANIAMLNALLDAVIVRLPVSWLFAFALNMGFSGIYYGQALSPILPAIVGFLYFLSKSWERKTLIQKSHKEEILL
jgi:MATE efflux family protein